MDITHIADLIQIRTYITGAINNFSLNKATAKELNNTLIMLDKKIVEQILSDEFKDLVDFEDVNAAIKEAMQNNNIKTGRKDIQSVAPVVVATGGKAQQVKPEAV